MDPLCHTLVGASLARTRLARPGLDLQEPAAVPLAGVTLILAANLPDVDFLWYFLDADQALAHRRGWTHGLLAQAVLPLVLWGVMLAWDRVRRRRNPAVPPAPAGHLLGLAYLGVLTHPFLDWLNTYGMRWWMPFDGTWSYGDTLFIVDPWIWLVLGGAVFLAGPPRGWGPWAWRGLWAALAVMATGAVFLGPSELPGAVVARGLWISGLLGVAGLAVSGPVTPTRRRRWAEGAVAALAVYIAVGLVATFAGRRYVWEQLAGGEPPGTDQLMVGPLPYQPFVRDVVARTGGRYRYGRLHWLPAPRLEWHGSLPTLPDTPPVTTALGAPCVEGFVTWMRFPSARVTATGEETGADTAIDPGAGLERIEGMPQTSPEGLRVYLLDVRYARRPTSSFGGARVEVAETPGGELEPVCPAEATPRGQD